MSHKCIRCGGIYEEGDERILRGCPVCGSVFFLYIKSENDLKVAEEIERELEKKDTSLERELEKKIEVEKRKVKKKFGIETIRISREGVYEINLEALMKSKPIIVLEKGKVYFVHLPSLFEEL